MKPKVFLSSTYYDLIEYRSQIWERLSKHNFQIFGMEKFGARSENPLSTCMSELEKAQVYIGIIGMRYGSIEPESKKSFTLLEYEHAISLKIPTLIYLIDEEKAVIKPIHIDHENYHALCAFKDQLKHNHTVSFFENPNDLAVKIENDLRQHFSKTLSFIDKIPKKLNACVFRTVLNMEDYCAIVSYNDNKPYQIYIWPTKSIYIPDFVQCGFVLYDRSDNVHSFEFIDRDGYSVVIRGVSRVSYFFTSILINRLLLNNLPLKEIKDILEDIYEMLPEVEKSIPAVLFKIFPTLLKSKPVL